jgi:integrase
VKKLPKRTMERFLSEAEAARLFDTLTAMEAEGAVQRVHADVVKVLLLTGARRSEIANLRWDEVDLGRGLLTLAPGRHKSGGAQGVKHITLNAPAAAVIAERPRIGAFVFPAPLAEKKGCDAGLGKAWERIRARADLQDVRLHDLRHSFASFGAAGGASLLLIGKALGHSQAATTARYAHLGNDPVRDLAEKVGQRIMGAAGRKEREGGDFVALRSRKRRKRESE